MQWILIKRNRLSIVDLTNRFTPGFFFHILLNIINNFLNSFKNSLLFLYLN